MCGPGLKAIRPGLPGPSDRAKAKPSGRPMGAHGLALPEAKPGQAAEPRLVCLNLVGKHGI
ncbi:hypothetical protein PHLCEN_2v1849 [Hermanssonia centrifuga]|uniref:Uncharacterized protein n=1 Tax=Hermanssonia centrifuga TaxID=98765 RepID=A0A2R6RVQ0_9APHY|nr:hypothetical protein PHLCEN_2v1849 [Hermanssonia centrifuga]